MAFDFDGTLTVRDSFHRLPELAGRPAGDGFGWARLVPAALAYLFHRDRGRIKAAAVRVFLAGRDPRALEARTPADSPRSTRACCGPTR